MFAVARGLLCKLLPLLQLLFLLSGPLLVLHLQLLGPQTAAGASAGMVAGAAAKCGHCAYGNLGCATSRDTSRAVSGPPLAADADVLRSPAAAAAAV